MTNVALIGYSHGGGTAYNLGRRILQEGILPPFKNRLVFAGTIDAVVRAHGDYDVSGAQPQANAPGGASSEAVNYYQPQGYILPGVHGTFMPAAARHTEITTVYYRDTNGVFHGVEPSHVNIYFDESVVNGMFFAVEDRLEQQPDF